MGERGERWGDDRASEWWETSSEWQEVSPVAAAIVCRFRLRAALSARAVEGISHCGDVGMREEIRAASGVSPKAFKQAIGALYRKGRITIESPRIKLVRADAGR